MTLSEAIESGKPFKRKDDKRYLIKRDNDIFETVENAGMRTIKLSLLAIREVLATDWELKPNDVKQERKEFWVNDYINSSGNIYVHRTIKSSEQFLDFGNGDKCNKYRVVELKSDERILDWKMLYKVILKYYNSPDKYYINGIRKDLGFNDEIKDED